MMIYDFLKLKNKHKNIFSKLGYFSTLGLEMFTNFVSQLHFFTKLFKKNIKTIQLSKSCGEQTVKLFKTFSLKMSIKNHINIMAIWIFKCLRKIVLKFFNLYLK